MASIRFVGNDGRNIDTINGDTQFRIKLDTGRTDGPKTLDVVFMWDDGDESDKFTITKQRDGTYLSTVVTTNIGGEGGGSVGGLGFEWSTGDVGPMDVEGGEFLSITYGDAVDRVRVFDTYVQEGIHLNRMFLSQVRSYYITLAMNLTSAINAFDMIGETNLNDEGQALLRLAREGLEIANNGIAVTGRAMFFLNNDQLMLDTQRFHISCWYLNRLKGDFDPSVTSNPDYTHSLRNYDRRGETDAVGKASARGRDHAEDVMWRQLGQATIAAYQLLVNATGAAQLMTLFGTNEMGREAKGWERLVALFDLAGQAAMMGAMMRFHVAHTTGRTQPRLRRDAAAVDPETAMTGARIDPTTAGVTDAAAAQAQIVARKHGVHILTRQSGRGVAELRTHGYSPKPMPIKSKTINELDVHLGAPQSGLRQVGHFEPRMPATRPAGMDDATWAALGRRYDQRVAEYNGPTGQKVRQYSDAGLVEVRNGVVYDTGLVSGSGKPITGDFDLFEIVFPNGMPVPDHIYRAVVGDLEAGPFQAMHGAHMRWDIQMGDWHTFADFVHAADVVDTNLGIYHKIVRSHHQEPLIVFGGDRPPYALTSDALPPIKWADLPAGVVGTTGAARFPLVNPTAGLRYATLPFLDADEATQLQLADQNWSTAAGVYDPVLDQFDPTAGLVGVDPPTGSMGPRPGFFRRHRGKLTVGAAGVFVLAGGTALLLDNGDDLPAVQSPDSLVVEQADDPTDGSTGAEPEDEAQDLLTDEVQPDDDSPDEVPPDDISADEPPHDPAIVAPLATVGYLCPAVTHSPPDEYPASLSWVLLDGILVAVRGIAPDGTLVLATPGADLDQVVAPVVDGRFSAIMPISSMMPYEVAPQSFTASDGSLVEIVPNPWQVDVGPGEGPIGSCTATGDLSNGERAAIEAEFRTADAPTDAPPDPLDPFREFLAAFDAAHETGDAEALLDSLAPVIIDIYGEPQCRSYLEGVVGSIGDVVLLDGRPHAPWTFSDVDGGDASVEVSDAFELDVQLSQLGGDPVEVKLHLSATEDGVRWYTDCGDPVS